uniref:SERPIN domain-containing protein n=1 Tax=Caenorhabditis tropicalis TaxID=1561998 RepID=A0A1I7TVJ6_9PELO
MKSQLNDSFKGPTSSTDVWAIFFAFFVLALSHSLRGHNENLISILLGPSTVNEEAVVSLFQDLKIREPESNHFSIVIY